MKVDNSVVWKWNPAAVPMKTNLIKCNYIFLFILPCFPSPCKLLFLPSSFVVLTNQNENKQTLIVFTTPSKKFSVSLSMWKVHALFFKRLKLCELCSKFVVCYYQSFFFHNKFVWNTFQVRYLTKFQKKTWLESYWSVSCNHRIPKQVLIIKCLCKCIHFIFSNGECRCLQSFSFCL